MEAEDICDCAVGALPRLPALEAAELGGSSVRGGGCRHTAIAGRRLCRVNDLNESGGVPRIHRRRRDFTLQPRMALESEVMCRLWSFV
eukprot:3255917-Alexandrium_andersonii.AAC.1